MPRERSRGLPCHPCHPALEFGAHEGRSMDSVRSVCSSLSGLDRPRDSTRFARPCRLHEKGKCRCNRFLRGGQILTVGRISRIGVVDDSDDVLLIGSKRTAVSFRPRVARLCSASVRNSRTLGELKLFRERCQYVAAAETVAAPERVDPPKSAHLGLEWEKLGCTNDLPIAPAR
jgi:hypothetical protein